MSTVFFFCLVSSSLDGRLFLTLTTAWQDTTNVSVWKSVKLLHLLCPVRLTGSFICALKVVSLVVYYVMREGLVDEADMAAKKTIPWEAIA